MSNSTNATASAAKSANVAAIYPLSPMQQGMLFHTVYSTDSTIYFNQLTLKIVGPLQATAFQAAWQGVVDRHPVLRTLFLWEKRRNPLQVVRKKVTLPWATFDWQTETKPQARLDDFLATDLAARINLKEAPLMRCTLIQVAAEVHYFVWSRHHLLSDGWSSGLVFKEVFELYQAAIEGRAPVLSPVYSYRDYITWLQKQDMAQAETFWRAFWQDDHTPTRLGWGQPAIEENPTNEQISTTLSPETTARLTTLARQQRLTLNTLLQGAWAILLNRYSGQEQVLFGATVSGRPPTLPGWESMVGLFINTLPVTALVKQNGLLLDWLQTLQANQVERDAYAYAPLSEIKKWRPGDSKVPLFESILVFENYPLEGMTAEQGALTISLVRDIEAANYPLTVTLDAGDTLEIRFIYHVGYFEPHFMTGILNHFQHLVEQLGHLATQPASRLAALRLLTATEREIMLGRGQGTPLAYPQMTCLHRTFEAYATAKPAALAAVCGPHTLTYAQLNAQANQVAHALIARGVGPGVFVGLCMGRSLGIVVGMLGILKAGGAYVPLEPTYPINRLKFVVEDTGLTVVLTEAEVLANLPPVEQVIVLDQSQTTLNTQHQTNPASPVTARNMAYIIYTSGSTGRPKGVMVEHHTVQAMLAAYNHIAPLPARLIGASVSPIGFDASVWDIFSVLCFGGTLHILPQDMLTDVPILTAYILTNQITNLYIPPGLLDHVIDDLEAHQQNSYLRRLFVGVEPIKQRTLGRLKRLMLDAKITNMYGPTETTVIAISLAFKTISNPEQRTPIGKALANYQIYLLDNHLEPVPLGVAGEVYIGGAGVSRGYLNRPAFTAERFIPNPFVQDLGFRSQESDVRPPSSPNPATRLYKTGDHARYLPDGNIEFLGRLDYQIKIRGFRVELSEIERVLTQYPAVQKGVLVAHSHNEKKQLTAYFIAAQPVEVETLRAYLQQQLPTHMLPTALIPLESFPLNPNGKIDRNALPRPNLAQVEQGNSFVPPRNKIETGLGEIWQDVLGVKPIGIKNDYFSLGGDSILSLQIVSQAKAKGWHISPKDIFENPTIATLAQVVSQEKQPQPTSHQQGLVTGAVPLIPIQRWFFERDWPALHHFNQVTFLQVPATIDPVLLAQAIAFLDQQHDALRLRYQPATRSPAGWVQVSETAGWVQVSETAVPASSFEVVDMSHLPVADQSQAITTEAGDWQTRLNLQTGPLSQFILFQLGAGRPARLLIICHHLVVDGVSWRILLADLATIYRQLAMGKAVSLPPKTTAFKTWATWLQTNGPQQVAAEQDYWLKVSRQQPTPLPCDLSTGENSIGSTQVIKHTLSAAETTALLQQVPQAYHTQINDILLSALLQSFHTWTGQTSLYLHLESHGRESLQPDFDLSRTVGWFTAMYPLYLHLTTTEAGALIKAIKEQLRQIPHNGLGYGILRYLAAESALAQTPTPQVSFNYMGQFRGGNQIADSERLWLGPAPEGSGPEQHPTAQRAQLINVGGMIVAGALEMQWTYSTNRHRPETIIALAEGYIKALRQLIVHCQTPQAKGYTPSDFPDLQLSQATLDEALGQIIAANTLSDAPHPQIQALYLLTSTQQGMLIETISRPAAGHQIEQQVWTWRGPLDKKASLSAWHRVMARHAILRTGFLWENQPEPIQFVLDKATLPVIEADWRGLSAPEQASRLAISLAEDRQQGFKMDQVPLMRLAIYQLADDCHQFVWTTHHILLDGWSVPIVLNEVSTFYEAHCLGLNLQLPVYSGYERYLKWLRDRDLSQAAAFWRQRLQGITRATPITMKQAPLERGENVQTGYGRLQGETAAETLTALRKVAQSEGLTLSTLLQGVWGMLLYTYSGQLDIIFGITVSGRPVDVPDVERMVGLFINTVPLRLTVSNEQPLLAWLREVQQQTINQQPYEYCTAGQIHQWSDLPGGRSLYQAVLVVENYPTTLQANHEAASFEIAEAQTIGAQTAYPLTILVNLNQTLQIKLVYQQACFEPEQVEAILTDFITVLTHLAQKPTDLVTNYLTRLNPQSLKTVNVIPSATSHLNHIQFIPPRDVVERQLATIWGKVLHLPLVSINHNFFDLGGHSLLAMRLITLINQQFGVNLLLSTLIQAPTIEKLAALLKDTPPLSHSLLVAIQPQGAGTPLFMIPGAGGNILHFYHLARYLPDWQPLYAFQSAGLDAGSDPHTSVPEMAAAYIKAMKQVQPQGPYLLVGHSFGAFPAFEMAQQLLKAGEQVAFLGIIDTGAPLPDRQKLTFNDEKAVLTEFAVSFSQWLGSEINMPYQPDLNLSDAALWNHFSDWLRQNNILSSNAEVTTARRLLNIFRIQLDMDYTPTEIYPLPVTIFPARDREHHLESDTLRWDELLPEVIVTPPIPGDHMTVVAEPHIQVLAERFTVQLQHIQNNLTTEKMR